MGAEYISRKLLDAYQDRWTLKIQKLHTKQQKSQARITTLEAQVALLMSHMGSLR